MYNNDSSTTSILQTFTKPTFHVKRPRGNLSLTIGEKARYYLNISTIVTTTPLAINLSLPIAGDEAFLTITDIQLESVGKNFGCFQLWDEEFIPTTVSSLGSSQNDTALIDFGVISNHGRIYFCNTLLLFFGIIKYHFLRIQALNVVITPVFGELP